VNSGEKWVTLALLQSRAESVPPKMRRDSLVQFAVGDEERELVKDGRLGRRRSHLECLGAPRLSCRIALAGFSFGGRNRGFVER
jgi:hypothetical protein